jgi:ABC-type protease/lipase transport system fused ATPase/permease subunit
LSPGLRRRIALAGVLAGGAPLVLLDNPLADCDEAESEALWQAVTGLLHRQGRTLLVAGRLPLGARVDRTWDVQRWQP